MGNIDISKLSKEILDEVINAGLEVFSKNTYVKASVNNIVEKTSISKGSFFNYFFDKFTFYCFLVDFSIKTLNDDFIDRIDKTSSDFFERMENISKIKLEIAYKYPSISDFLISAYFETDDEVVKFFKTKTNAYLNENKDFMYGGIDISNLRDGVTIDDMLDIITYISEGVGKKYRGQKGTYKMMIDEFSRMINIIKPCLLKE